MKKSRLIRKMISKDEWEMARSHSTKRAWKVGDYNKDPECNKKPAAQTLRNTWDTAKYNVKPIPSGYPHYSR